MLYITGFANSAFEYLYVIAISTYRFVFAGPAALASGFNYWEISICLAIGGVSGFFAFYYFSDVLITLFRKMIATRNSQKRFKWFVKNRNTLRKIHKTGLLLLLIPGPVILSIPLTAFFAQRWYNKQKHIIVYFCISVTGWAFIFGILARFNLVQ
ncbi:MAG: hypothetical protein CVU11_06105 [Bacteroidetes bacterium HGW-Bacteroidetes-6]|jgi:hypothetical protein|nr:MAG: hypothetical protein CVU11_06105 [Bacteroidetes bacterium HGW-Bacteroidetes-6]